MKRILKILCHLVEDDPVTFRSHLKIKSKWISQWCSDLTRTSLNHLSTYVSPRNRQVHAWNRYNEICSDFQPWPVFNRRKPSRIHGESNRSETEGAWKRLTLSYAGADVPRRVEREMKRNEGRALPPNCVEDPRWISRLAGNVNQNVTRSTCMHRPWKSEAVVLGGVRATEW